MASSIPLILARKILPAAAAAGGTVAGSNFIGINNNYRSQNVGDNSETTNRDGIDSSVNRGCKNIHHWKNDSSGYDLLRQLLAWQQSRQSSILGSRAACCESVLETPIPNDDHETNNARNDLGTPPTRKTQKREKQEADDGVATFLSTSSQPSSPEPREMILRKRMTSIGRFSWKSETTENPSVPTFFLALSGKTNNNSQESSDSKGGMGKKATTLASPGKSFTVSDFESLWLRRNMPALHPRFHSTVSSTDDRYFEEIHQSNHKIAAQSTSTTGNASEKDHSGDPLASHPIKAEMNKYATETMHYSVYRQDLRRRIENLLSSPLNVTDKLWEVQISNGVLGSSGAISRAKAEAIHKKRNNDNNIKKVDTKDKHDMTLEAPVILPHTKESSQTSSPSVASSTKPPPIIRRRTTLGRLWRDVAREAESNASLAETVLLFRSHHALADGVSIMAALSDLCDEAEYIRAEIREEFRRRRFLLGQKHSKKNRFHRWILKLLHTSKMIILFTLGTIRSILFQGYLYLITPTNPFQIIKNYYAIQKQSQDPSVVMGDSVDDSRSISWCDVTTLEEAKQIVKFMKKKLTSDVSGDITINDLFVSCVTSAIARQLKYHQDVIETTSSSLDYVVSTTAKNIGTFTMPEQINIVVPVHLQQGILLPNESVGNKIGAFVARVPGLMDDQCSNKSNSTQRLVQVHNSLYNQKYSPTPVLSYYLAKFCSEFFPHALTQRLFANANANAIAVITNTRGSTKKLHLDGRTIESVAGFIPLPPGIPIGIVVQSYAGVVSLSITAERYAVPDADLFLMWVLEEYRKIGREAGVCK